MELETTSGQSGRKGHAKTFMVKEHAVREERRGMDVELSSLSAWSRRRGFGAMP